MGYIGDTGVELSSSEVDSIISLTNLAVSTATQAIQKTSATTFANVEIGSDAYVLPNATASVLGGIKVGTRLSIDGNGVLSADVQTSTPEGTAIKSTGEAGGTKFLREDGDGTCSWQTPGGGGTVTSVAALTLGTTGTDLSSTVANETTTPVITLQVPTASATNRGALSAADWTTFNNKLSAEADTLATVTGRGASTATASTFSGGITAQKLAIDGTAGAGFITLVHQSSNPTAPAAGTALIHARTQDGFTRIEQDNEGATNIVLGRDSVIVVKNDSGGAFALGDVVYIKGVATVTPTVAKARANASGTLPALGIVMDAAADGAFCRVMRSGILTMNTTAFSAADKVYVSTATAGALQSTRPSGITGAYVQRIGTILTQGATGLIEIEVSPSVLNMETGTTAATFAANAVTATTYNGNTLTTGTGTITITGTKTLTVADTASVSGTNTGDTAANSTSNTYADGKVADAINDGTTTIAPSQNAVFDALALKAPLTSPTFATSINGSYLTASEILITDASKNIVSAPVATYPSLTELSYVKGVTSAIQTQLGARLPLAGGTMTGKIIKAGTTEVGKTYTPATGAQTVALDCAVNNIHVVSGHADGTAITFTVANATSSQPFIVSILQGGTTVSTIAAWFATVRWAGGTAPTLTATLNKRDTFGFIRTGTDTYDGFVIGQNC